MARRLDVLPAAVDEALASTRWYFERDERVAYAFEAELSRAFAEIERAPDVVLIIAVAHCKRSPVYWRHR